MATFAEMHESPANPAAADRATREVADASLRANTAALRRLALWTIVGVALGLVAALVAFRVMRADATPELTPAAFHAAHERWLAAAPQDYNIEVRVTGSQPAVYRVEVRGGHPQAAWRNGHPLNSRRTFGTWSVPGMFSTMSRDVEALERHAAGQADAFTPRLTLRAEFDARFAYPARYWRIEWGSSVEVAWEVTAFRLVP